MTAVPIPLYIYAPSASENVLASQVYSIKAKGNIGINLNGIIDYFYTTSSIAIPPYNTSDWILITSSYYISQNYYYNLRNEVEWSASWNVPYISESNVRVAFVTSSDLTDQGITSSLFSVYPYPHSYVELEYSTDSGSIWYPIDITMMQNNTYGSYIWIAPETSSNQYLIRISSGSISDTTNAVFEIAQPTFVSGTIYPFGLENTSGITLTFTGVGEIFYTNTSGYYTASILSSSYTGSITPSKTNFVFSPVSASITASGNTGSFDFIATYIPPPPVTYLLSGSVFVSGTNTPISNATIIVSTDLGTFYPFTDINGQFSTSISPLTTDVSVYAYYAKYNIYPAQIYITSPAGNINNIDFSGSIIRYMISGSIVSSSGIPLSGIEILCDACSASLFTDANGNYSRSYDTGSNILLTPISNIYSFVPSNRLYTLLSSSINNENYIGITALPAYPGLGAYYDSRKSYDATTNSWEELTGHSNNITTYNTYYTNNKNLYFGTPWLGIATASFESTIISSSFAIEMWIAPYKSISTNLITNPQFSGSLGFTGWNTYLMSIIYTSAPPPDLDFPLNEPISQVAQFDNSFTSVLSWEHTSSKVGFQYEFTFYTKTLHSGFAYQFPIPPKIINYNITQDNGSTILKSGSFDNAYEWQKNSINFTPINQSNIMISMSPTNYDVQSKIISDNFILKEFNPLKTLFATSDGVYPHFYACISSSIVKFEYASSIISAITRVTSSAIINEEKFNHIVLYVSQSNMSTWINGQWFASASISSSDWLGAIISTPNLPYHGYVDLLKVWNDVNINMNEINTYYQNKNYWPYLQNITFATLPGKSLFYTENDSVVSYIVAASGPSSPPMSGSEVTIYISSSIISPQLS